MRPLGRVARSRVIYNISRVGATRWRQWLDTVAVYYPIPSECNNPHATSATVPGETAMVKRLLGALRTGPPVIKHQQGNNPTCVFSSAASAIHAFGDELAAESLASQAKESIKQSVNRVHFLQQTVLKELKGWDVPKVLKGDAAAAFDCLATRSPYPTCILIHGTDGSTDHCITTLGDWIFDSNMPHALPLCQASLNQCVDLDGEGVTFKRCTWQEANEDTTRAEEASTRAA